MFCNCPAHAILYPTLRMDVMSLHILCIGRTGLSVCGKICDPTPANEALCGKIKFEI